MKPLEDVRQISALTYGFIASKALFAALDLDLFTKIAKGTETVPALAEATGIPPNRLRTLLTALKTIGLISEAEGKFTNAPATEAYLVSGAAGDFRDYIRVVNGGFLYEGLHHLEKSMRGERIFPDKGFYEGIVYSEGGVGGSAFSSAQHAGSLGPARLMARRVDLAGVTKLLDVGGGSGAYTLAFLKQNPKLQATILDFPETTETARRYAAEAGMSDRVAHVQGNAITTEWPGQQDVVLMSYVWSAIGGNDIKTLALPPQRLLIVIAIAAVLQVLVHLRFFLHLDLTTTPRENLLAIVFTAILIFIMVGGSLWIMIDLHSRMVM